MTNDTKFPYSGRSFEITFDNGLKVTNAYREDGEHVDVAIHTGALVGTRMTVRYGWKPLAGGNFLMSWQEEDGSTVVHSDNFEAGVSDAFYTTMAGEFYVMSGRLS